MLLTGDTTNRIHAAPAGAAITAPAFAPQPQSPGRDPKLLPLGLGESPRRVASDTSNYYAAADGKAGADLLHTLGLIIRTGHSDRGYAQARDGLFQLVADPDRDDKIEDVYTGELRGPITDRKNAMDHGINAEHTWPQSKGATGIAQSDLHQLMAADKDTNQRRGNLPYGVVTQASWTVGSGTNTSKLGVDALGTTVFEPRDSVKGDIARGLLYFYTRYVESPTSKFTLENFRHELPVLVKWAAQDPVDDNERSRNEDVFAIQGNRNPFIDHPEWIEKAGFPTLKLGGTG